MNRSQRTRAVYQELRAATRGSIPAGQLLSYADQLVGIFFNEEAPSFSLRVGGQRFDSWALDRVMADGGWRVLDRFGSTGLDDEEEWVGDPLVASQLRELGVEICV